MHKITLYWGVRNYSDRIVNQDLSLAANRVSFECNFAEGDGIEASLTVNVGQLSGAPNCIMDFPTYLTAESDDGATERDTHWFVTNAVKTRQGQLALSLRRDLAGEKWDSIRSLPFLCSKASDLSDSSLAWAKYAKTSSLSEVKIRDERIIDRDGGKGWLVGYIDKDFIKKKDSTATEVELEINENQYDYDYLLDGDVTSWPYYGKTYKTGAYAIKTEFHIKASYGYNETQYVNVYKNRPSPYSSDETSYSGQTYPINILQSYAWTAWEGNKLQVKNDVGAALADAAEEAIDEFVPSDLETNNVLFLRNKILAVRDELGNVTRYKISVSVNWETPLDGSFSEKMYAKMASDLMGKAYPVGEDSTKYFANMQQSSDYRNAAIASVKYVTQTVSLTLISDSALRMQLKANRTHTADALYDVFAIPLGGSVTYQTDSATGATATLSLSDLATDKVMLLLSGLYREFGDYLYDVQLLPYCLWGDGDAIPLGVGKSFGDGYSFAPICEGTEITQSTMISMLIWLSSSQAQKTLSSSGESWAIELPSGTENLRIWNEEHLVRLAGPNYASQFEFSPVKNDGFEGVNIYMAFKPYSPYIRIAPIFGGLYGSDYNDDRGLVLSGDFSLDRTSDAWTQYKLQNKNYELIFNRQIQSMDLKNELADRLDRQAMLESALGVASGAVSGAASGAVSGFRLGGVAGSAAGALVGAAANAAAGAYDFAANAGNLKYSKAIRDDERQAAIDQFQYQIGNVRAMPDAMTRISAFNPDYRIYPVLEVYECTSEEDSNLKSAAKWNGFDVGKITQLSAFKTGFVKGSLLRFDGAGLSFREAFELNAELERGVYLT